MLTLLIIAAVLIVLLILIVTRPDENRVSRSITIDAPASVIFPYANTIPGWLKWSPFEKNDPAAQRSFFGPEAGVDSGYAWNGNNRIGQGRFTITESRSNQYVGFRLEFTRPFTATNSVEFVLTPAGEGTTFTWTMVGKNNFMLKAFSLVFHSEKMIAGQFDEGLAKLRALTERPSR